MTVVPQVSLTDFAATTDHITVASVKPVGKDDVCCFFWLLLFNCMAAHCNHYEKHFTHLACSAQCSCVLFSFSHQHADTCCCLRTAFLLILHTSYIHVLYSLCPVLTSHSCGSWVLICWLFSCTTSCKWSEFIWAALSTLILSVVVLFWLQPVFFTIWRAHRTTVNSSAFVLKYVPLWNYMN